MIRPTITTSLPEFGADIVQIGAEGDLARGPGAILRYRSQSFSGTIDVDLHALALGAFQAAAIADEPETPGSSSPHADDRSELIERLYALAARARDADEAFQAAPRPRKRVTMDDLDDPDIVGASEYRAVHELLEDAAADITDPDEWRAMALGVLGETLSYASQLIARIANVDAS